MKTIYRLPEVTRCERFGWVVKHFLEEAQGGDALGWLGNCQCQIETAHQSFDQIPALNGAKRRH